MTPPLSSHEEWLGNHRMAIKPCGGRWEWRVEMVIPGEPVVLKDAGDSPSFTHAFLNAGHVMDYEERMRA